MFVVSEDDDITPALGALLAEGWDVIHGDGAENATELLDSHEWLIVIAHGSREGAVYMCSAGKTPTRWLWPDMDLAALGCRTYLYCCYAGKRLVPKFPNCEIFGHVDRVPMPTGQSNEDYVTRYLALVFDTMSSDGYDLDTWQSKFMAYLDLTLTELSEKPIDDEIGLENFYVIHMLRQSLNFGKPMWPQP